MSLRPTIRTTVGRATIRKSIDSRISGLSLDSDAAAWIAAREAAGEVMTITQKQAINTFIKAEKLTTRWAAMKRLYLPTSGIAAANAIDVMTKTSGTFAGTVTHSAGYVQGNGTTGYFNTGAIPSVIGMTNLVGGFGWLSPGGGTGTSAISIGAQDDVSQTVIGRWDDTTGLRLNYNDGGTGMISGGASAISSNHGIISMGRFSTARRIRRRTSSGVTSIAQATGGASGLIPSSSAIIAMGYNNNGAPTPSNTIQYGAWWVHSGMTIPDDDAFTLNLKTLWETLTGLTIP